jgi:hypothetical protein
MGTIHSLPPLVVEPPQPEVKLTPSLGLVVGAICMVKMRAHTHSPGQRDYYAPGVVVHTYQDTLESVDIQVWDSTAGNMPWLNIGTRHSALGGIDNDKAIGEILFHPVEHAQLKDALAELQAQVIELRTQLEFVAALAEDNSKPPSKGK